MEKNTQKMKVKKRLEKCWVIFFKKKDLYNISFIKKI